MNHDYGMFHCFACGPPNAKLIIVNCIISPDYNIHCVDVVRIISFASKAFIILSNRYVLYMNAV